MARGKSNEKRRPFGVRLSASELEALERLSRQWERTRGDTLRHLLRAAARQAAKTK